MLRWRLILSAIIIPILVGLCWLDVRRFAYQEGAWIGGFAEPGAWLYPLAFLVAFAASWEFAELLAAGGWRISKPLLIIGNLAIVASRLRYSFAFLRGNMEVGTSGFKTKHISNTIVIFALCVFAAFLVEIVRYAKDSKALQRVSLTVLGFAYIGLMLTCVVWLRQLHTDLRPLLSLIVVVKLADIGAYAVGRLIGKNKMTPILSPGKTWEGAVGGLVFACIGAWLVNKGWPQSSWFPGPNAGNPGVEFVLFGLLVGAAGMIGDLAESMIKRETGQKDSSKWMPGLGGVLDIIDSVLLAAPVALFLWLLGKQFMY